jgi:hypothetical protein
MDEITLPWVQRAVAGEGGMEQISDILDVARLDQGIFMWTSSRRIGQPGA